jgi:hypothetical protein
MSILFKDETVIRARYEENILHASPHEGVIATEAGVGLKHSGAHS